MAVAADEVVRSLVAALDTKECSDNADDFLAVSRCRLVARALDILHATPAEPVSVASVCDALGVTERTLQRAFQDCLGMSLRAYERERRLRGVHGAIFAEGNRRSITELAMSFGFWHLGRFSGAYAALFGCLPTETRRRVWVETRDEPLDAFADPSTPEAIKGAASRRRFVPRPGSRSYRQDRRRHV